MLWSTSTRWRKQFAHSLWCILRKGVEKSTAFAGMQVVCDFCEAHLEANKAAFADPRFQLVVDDARAQLEKWPGTFDVIIGDLADPVYGGPCYQVLRCASSHAVLHLVCTKCWFSADKYAPRQQSHR